MSAWNFGDLFVFSIAVDGVMGGAESVKTFSELKILSTEVIGMAVFGAVSALCGASIRSKLSPSPSVTVMVVIIVLELSVEVLMLVSMEAELLPMTTTFGTTWSAWRVVILEAAAMTAAALPEDMRPVLKCSRRSALVAVEIRSSVGPDCEFTVIFWCGRGSGVLLGDLLLAVTW